MVLMKRFLFSRRSSATNEDEPKQAVVEPEQEDWLSDYEGQLAVDAYETGKELVIKAPVAGVAADRLDIQVTDTQVTIKGQREDAHQLDAENYYLQECYWGSFSRSFELPFPVDSKKAKASVKDGLLSIRLPKDENAQAKKLTVDVES